MAIASNVTRRSQTVMSKCENQQERVNKNTREHIQRIGRATRPGRIAKIFELIVDPQYTKVEWEVAEQRDIRNVIEPWIQDSLVEKSFLKEIENSFKGNQDKFYLK